MARSADLPGMYTIVHDGTKVAPGEELSNNFVARLDKGATVKVVEVVRRAEDKRVRGRLESPAGWISLVSTETGYRWARACATPGVQGAASDGKHEPTRSEDEGQEKEELLQSQASLPLPSTSWTPLLTKHWQTRMPVQHRPAASLSFDERGVGTQCDTIWRTTRRWNPAGEGMSAGKPYRKFNIQVFNAAGREEDSGTADVFTEEPGWMRVRFAMRCGSSGFYLFSKSDLNAAGEDTSGDVHGRFCPVFCDAWSGVPEGVRPGALLDFTAPGCAESSGPWHFTLGPMPGWTSAVPSWSGDAAQLRMEVVESVFGARLPAQVRTVELQAAWPGFIAVVGAAEGGEDPPLRMFFSKTVHAPLAPPEPGYLACSWAPVSFALDAATVLPLVDSEAVNRRAETEVAPHDLLTRGLWSFFQCFSHFLGSDVKTALPALPAGSDPKSDKRLFIEGDADQETQSRGFCVNSTLVGPQAEPKSWCKRAIAAAEKHLLSSPERERLWSLLLLAAVALTAEDDGLALTALAAVSASLGDAADGIRALARQILEQVAARRPEGGRPGVSAAPRVMVHVPVPRSGEADGGAEAVAGEPEGEPAIARPEPEVTARVRRTACSALQRAPLEGSVCSGHGLRILLLSNGSRGDVQPMIVLANHLRERGCALQAIVRINLVDLCKSSSLDALPGFPDLDFMFHHIGGVSPENVHRLGEGHEEWRRRNPGRLVDVDAKIREFRPDAVLWSAGDCHPWANRYEDLSGVPAIPVVGSGLAAALNHYSEAVRRTPARPVLVPTSVHLDNTCESASVNGLLQSGAWVPEEEPSAEELASEPLSSLLAFLDSGPAPVAVGWGSLLADGVPPVAMLVRALVAARTAGQRVVVIGGWAKLHDLGHDLAQGKRQKLLQAAKSVDDVVKELLDRSLFDLLSEFARSRCFFLASASHRWLFPRCSCVVHHGGAGTTHAVLAAGVPCVLTPIAWDQWQWAKAVERLAVGHGFTQHLRHVTSGALAGAIVRALGMADEASRLGEKMRREPGVQLAAETLCRFLRHSASDGGWKRRCQSLQR